MASSNTVIQSLTDDDKRGRVMSLFAMAFTGTSPIGQFLIGSLAGGRVGVRWTMVGCGACCAVCAGLYFLRLPQLRAAAAPILARLDNAPALTGAEARCAAFHGGEVPKTWRAGQTIRRVAGVRLLGPPEHPDVARRARIPKAQHHSKRREAITNRGSPGVAMHSRRQRKTAADAASKDEEKLDAEISRVCFISTRKNALNGCSARAARCR